MPPTRLGQSGGIVPTSRGMPRRRSFIRFLCDLGKDFRREAGKASHMHENVEHRQRGTSGTQILDECGSRKAV
jgi:hypothetical protein